ncbi:MAG TPA: hypothetical protein VM534_08070, partial [Thermoanaerobaculia bacterium]|nr:hypothetical protein [Thermoanaerobaculia bacterium]
MKRENVVTVTLVAALLVVSMVVLVREMTRRAQRGGGDDVVAGPPLPAIPVETWTARIRGMMQIGAWEDLDRELRTLRDTDSERFRGYRLGYLHAHVLIELEQWEEAGAMLVPFLRPGDPLRDLALYHAARIEERSGEPADAALLRERLIFNHPDSVYRPAAIEEHLAVLRDD